MRCSWGWGSRCSAWPSTAVLPSKRLAPSVPTCSSSTFACRLWTGSQPPVVATGLPPRVLILTTYDLDEYVYQALRAGAGGFVLKSSPPDRLVDPIHVVAAGEALLGPSLTQRLIAEHVPATPRPAPVFRRSSES